MTCPFEAGTVPGESRMLEQPGQTKNTQEFHDGFEIECGLVIVDGGAFAVLGFLAARPRNSPAYPSAVVLGRNRCEALS